MNLKLPISLKKFFNIVRASDEFNVCRFAELACEYLNGEDVYLIDKYVDHFKIDTSEREAEFYVYIARYSEVLLEMGFLEHAVQYVMSRITLDIYRTVPPFDEVVERVYRAPRTSTLGLTDFVDVDHLIKPGELVLTDLQQRIYDHAVANPPVRGAFVLATGFGKTVLAAFLARNSFDNDSRLLFLVNSLVIKNQAELAFRQILGVPCVDFDGNNYNGEQAVFCTFYGASKLPMEFSDKITHLIVDEAHHVLAPTFFEVFTRFRERATRMVAGFTATLTHLTDVDGKMLREAFFNQLYCDLPWTTAKQLNLFPPVRYIEVLGPVGYRISYFSDESAYARLLAMHSKEMNLTRFLREVSIELHPTTLQLAQCLATYFAQFGPRSRTLCFLRSIQECDAFCALFNGMQDFSACTAVHYRADVQTAQAALREFRGHGGSRVIATVAMATEGFDVPHVDCVLLGRPTQSERVFVQQMGRGLRKSAAKRDVLILDCVGALRARWLRLRDEQRDEEVWRQILAFWPVESCV